MKKFVCTIFLFVCFVGYAFSQEIIEYCCTHRYIDGVKQRLEKPEFIYITFIDNYNRMYKSDEDGNCAAFMDAYGSMTDWPSGKARTSGLAVKYKYVRTVNDYVVYEPEPVMLGRRTVEPIIKNAYMFSKDKSLLNIGPSNPWVYKRVSKREKEEIINKQEGYLPELLQ